MEGEAPTCWSKRGSLKKKILIGTTQVRSAKARPVDKTRFWVYVGCHNSYRRFGPLLEDFGVPAHMAGFSSTGKRGSIAWGSLYLTTVGATLSTTGFRAATKTCSSQVQRKKQLGVTVQVEKFANGALIIGIWPWYQILIPLCCWFLYSLEARACVRFKVHEHHSIRLYSLPVESRSQNIRQWEPLPITIYTQANIFPLKFSFFFFQKNMFFFYKQVLRFWLVGKFLVTISCRLP